MEDNNQVNFLASSYANVLKQKNVMSSIQIENVPDIVVTTKRIQDKKLTREYVTSNVNFERKTRE